VAGFPIGAAPAGVGHAGNDVRFRSDRRAAPATPRVPRRARLAAPARDDDRLLVRHVLTCGGSPQKRLRDDVKQVTRAMLRISVEDHHGTIQACTLTDTRVGDDGRLGLPSTPGAGPR